MAANERKVRWPDGVSFSVPFPIPPGRTGGTYYWSPGADTMGWRSARSSVHSADSHQLFEESPWLPSSLS